MQKSNLFWYCCLLFICALYVFLRVPLIDIPFRHDERYFSWPYLSAFPFFDSGERFYDTWADTWREELALHPPLLYLFYFIWIPIFGNSEISLHVPAFLAGLATVFLLASLLIKIFDHQVALIASAICAASLSGVYYSTQAIYPIFESLICVLLFYAHAQYLSNRPRNSSFLFLMWSACIAWLTFYHAVIFFFIIAISLLIHNDRTKKELWACGVLGFMAVVVGYIWWTSSQTNIINDQIWQNVNFAKVVEWYSRIPFLTSPEIDIAPPSPLAECLLALLCIGVLSLVWTPRKKYSRKVVHFSLCAFLLLPGIVHWIACFFLYSLGHPRNFAYLLPIYCSLVAVGICVIPRFNSLRWIVGVGVAGLCAQHAIAYSSGRFDIWYFRRCIMEVAAQSTADRIVITGGVQSGYWITYYSDQYAMDADRFILGVPCQSLCDSSHEQTYEILSVGPISCPDRASKDSIIETKSRTFSNMPFSFIHPRSYTIYSYLVKCS